MIKKGEALMQSPSLAYTKKEKNSVLFSTLFGYGLDFYNILIISFIMGAIQKSLNLSLTQAGIITTVTLAGSVIGGVLFGWLGDRVGRKNWLLCGWLGGRAAVKKSLLGTLGLFSVGAILSAFAWDFNSLLVTRAISGIG